MKLPNGYGSVVKMSGRRRRPYCVRKTIGWEYDPTKDKMIQKYIVIGYAETRKAGMQMLSEYNSHSLDIQSHKATFEDVYKSWSAGKFSTVSASAVSAYQRAFRLCKPLHHRKMATLKLSDLQNLIDNCDKNFSNLKNIKILLSQLFVYAVKNDICDKNYARYVDTLKHKDKNPHKRTTGRISSEDITVLWQNEADIWCQTILMLIYNGCRIAEFLDLKKVDVHLEEQYFNVVSAKTENGVRCVPIADNVLPFYREWYSRCPESEYLISTSSGEHMKYGNYYNRHFIPTLHKHSFPPYTPHYTRHTTASLMADVGVDPTLQKKILGHAGAMSLTERVYTHPDIAVLVSAVNRICILPDAYRNNPTESTKV